MTFTTREIPLNCCRCKAPVTVEIVDPRILNQGDVSTVVMFHDAAVTCANCSLEQRVVLAGVNGYMFGLTPVVPDPKASRIVVPSSSRIT